MTEVVVRPNGGVKPWPSDGRDSINRDVPIPYYYQLEGLLREQVHAGRWEPGQQVPSEKQLCERYSVSRTTVRQAVGNLVQEGLLYHVKGKGTFVRKRSG
jgi:GntR family transcriptional regulator, N-acetylglucosamine utilization regulator